jgi:hypothetical protein
MVDIPFVTGDYYRSVADSPSAYVRNRFMEENPALNDEKTAFIARPGLKKFVEVGSGPIRRVYSCEGTFNNDLFAVSGLFLWRVNINGQFHEVGQLGEVLTDAVSMAATAPLGSTPDFLYIADGGILWFYCDNAQATADLNATSAITNGDTVQIDTTYYQFTTGSVDAGSPAGTSANPWLVAIGISNLDTLTSFYYAINASGTAGTDYSTALQANPTCTAYSSDATDVYIQYNTFGSLGNAIVSVATGTGLSFLNGSNFTGGGTEELRQVQVPDDSGAISVAYINGYIIVVPVQTADIMGRFYWINPGANTIDPLNYATAERSPDGITQVLVFGDMFWLMGQVTTEPWVTTGVFATPMERYQGILYDRGCWQDTAVQVKNSIILVDEDGAVFQIQSGQNRISTPAIEERIRLALQRQQFAIFA